MCEMPSFGVRSAIITDKADSLFSGSHCCCCCHSRSLSLFFVLFRLSLLILVRSHLWRALYPEPPCAQCARTWYDVHVHCIIIIMLSAVLFLPARIHFVITFTLLPSICLSICIFVILLCCPSVRCSNRI